MNPENNEPRHVAGAGGRRSNAVVADDSMPQGTDRSRQAGKGPQKVRTPGTGRQTVGLSAWPVLIIPSGRKIPDPTGETFGLLTVVAYAGHNAAHRAMWDCACECGEKVTVRWDHLRDGGTQSCGCLSKRRMAVLNRTHGKSGTPLYRVWRGMIDRCENKNNANFQHYGGRGIVVCAEWRKSFEAFERDMGPGYRAGLSIDRINNSLGYFASNCRWATDTEQNRNRRFNRLITFEGETRCLAEWAELAGIKYSTLSQRLNRGWSVDRAFAELQPRRAKGAHSVRTPAGKG
ncbi:hypothetical protein OHB41_07760 [Streptomyces sp. NBC_01571]|uniref:hypothetical protein n=1 Tax=Streptomyces sp. NBC_01571 TaxID=2975883 RepID=UPI00225B55F1|nr:hypothetical protein [Streptomyces sp. NBC_01571]MCX4573081.1 hypothetical protein [Streptomyces sp. NBC_01571]